MENEENLNKCPNCGNQNPDSSNFCLKCGTNLKSDYANIIKENNISTSKCLNCGTINDNDSQFCIDCGAILKSDNSSDKKIACPYCGSLIPTNASKCKNCGEWINKNIKPKNYTLAIVLGYVFTLLGGLIGLIIAIYLLTRDNPHANEHGEIQLVISIIWVILIILLIIS